jgi:hypothetical protein
MRSDRSAAMAAFALAWVALSHPDPRAAEAAAPGDSAAVADSADAAADAAADAGPEEAASAVSEADDEEDADPAPPLWMETYTEGVFSRHDDRNLSGFSDFKIGKRFPLKTPVDPYLKTRLYRDQRDYFWNNRVDAGVGVRISLLKKVSLIAFGEIIGGQYLRLSSGALGFEGMQGRIDGNRMAIDQAQKQFQAMYKDIFQAALLGDDALNREVIARLDTTGNIHLASLARLDAHLDSLETAKDSLQQVMDSVGLVPAGGLIEYRAGLVFWHGWGQEAPADGGEDPLGGPGARIRFPLRFWGEVYSEWIFSSLGRHVRTRGNGTAYRDSVARFRNLIFYANPNVGVMVMEGLTGSLSAYGAAYVWFDTHKDWWNNLALVGPGLRYKPLGMLDLAFKAEYLWGRYYGRERKEDPNPYARNVRDVRITGSFWYGLGI